MNAPLRRPFLSVKRLMIVLVLMACASIGVAAPPSSSPGALRLELRAGSFDPRSEKAPTLPAVAKQLPAEARHLARGLSRFVLVQFEGPILSEWQDAIRATGAEVVRYMPDYALVVRAEQNQLAAIQALPTVRWLGQLRPEWRVEPEILRSLTGSQSSPSQWAIVAQRGESVAPVLNLILRSFPEVEFLKGGASDHRIIVRVPGREAIRLLKSVLDHELVAWIEPWVEPLPKNNESIWVIQSGVRNAGDINSLEYTNSAPIWAHDILGTGQVVTVADSGLTDNDCFFAPAPTHQNVAAPGAITIDNALRKVIAYNWFPGGADGDSGNAAINYHGSHVAGSVLGDNSTNTSTATTANHNSGDGMAPQARVIFQDIGGTADLGGIPNDLRDMFTQAYNAGSRIHTNSWGASVEGVYTSDSQAVDDYNYRLGEDMTILFAASNDGATATKEVGGENDTIGSPGTAKNCITVGALRNGAHSSAAQNLVYYSSRGNTDDGRTKPDITAPGDAVVSHDGDATACNTQSMGGTSMATPTVAGGAALVHQYFKEGWYPSGTKTPADAFDPTAAAVKAVVTAGARALTGLEEYCSNYNVNLGCISLTSRAMAPSPNSMQGWGRLTLIDSLWFASAPSSNVRLKLWDVPNNAGNETGQIAEYSLPGVVAGTRLHINLAWSDAPGTLGAAKALVNDLNLEVVAPNGTTIHRGNQWASTGNQQPRESAVGPLAWDSTNNLEGVQIAAPASGDYLIRVHAFNVPGYAGYFQNRQGYAIAATGNFTQSCTLPAPTALTAVASGSNQISLSWASVSGATRYAIYRSLRGQSGCSTGMAQIGQTNGATFVDTSVIGGHEYSYYVKTLAPCDGPASNCVSATASGSCTLPPVFAGVSAAASATDGTCAIDLSWNAASSSCPLGNDIVYNIYRSSTPSFSATPANLVVSCISSLSYRDDSVSSGITYYYVVRAEDGTSGNGGPCNGGNEESNNVIASATPYGSGTGTIGTWTDGAGDMTAQLTREGSWSIVSTSDSASYVHTGMYSYKTSPGTSNYPSNACNSLTTPTLGVGTANPVVTFWERHAIEDGWDGVVVEYSVNGGAWTVATAGTTSCFDASGASGANACGLTSGTQGYENNGGNATTLTAWAQRSFTAAAPAGATLAVRWRLASDTAVEELGFVLDDIAISNIALPNPCTACTPPAVPSPTATAGPSADEITLTWSQVPSATAYYVYRADGACPASGYSLVQTINSGSTTSWTDTTVTGGSTYSYTMSSFAVCESAQSSCTDATAFSCTTPQPPSALTTSTPANNTIRLSWTASPTTGVTYTVYRSDGACPGGAFAQVASGISSTTWDDTGVAGGSTHAYQVSAVSFTCESATTSCADATATGGPGIYSSAIRASGSPRNTLAGQSVRWIYSSAATAMNPPTINSAVYAASNDRLFHSVERSATGGRWPRTAPKDWKPLVMNAPAQGRSTVYTLSIEYPSTPGTFTTRVAYLASQDGRVYCVDADNGSLLWTSAVLGDMLQGLPSIYARKWDSSGSPLGVDLILIGTRNSSGANDVVGLNAATGAVVWTFDNGGGASAVGMINGGIIVDQANKLAWFASRKLSGGSSNTLWNISFDDTGAAPTLMWAADADDIDGTPTSRGTTVYVGNNAGTVSAWAADPGVASPPALWTFDTSNGPIKEMVFPDYSNSRIYFSTTDRVWCLVDNTSSASEAWSTPATGSGSIARPSRPLPYLGTAWIGSSDGHVYKITGITTLTGAPSPVSIGNLGGGAVGAPSIDGVNDLLHAGTEGGLMFAVTP